MHWMVRMVLILFGMIAVAYVFASSMFHALNSESSKRMSFRKFWPKYKEASSAWSYDIFRRCINYRCGAQDSSVAMKTYAEDLLLRFMLWTRHELA